jgi:hypothetical protein
MGMTLRQYMDDRLRWVMFEKGLQAEWNYLNQIVNSLAGSGVTGGTTELGTVDLTAATGVNKNASKTFSGTFAPGAQAGGTGFTVPPGDIAGNVGPNPARISQRIPTAGFRINT